jgi:hypothetical protein
MSIIAGTSRPETTQRCKVIFGRFAVILGRFAVVYGRNDQGCRHQEHTPDWAVKFSGKEGPNNGVMTKLKKCWMSRTTREQINGVQDKPWYRPSWFGWPRFIVADTVRNFQSFPLFSTPTNWSLAFRQTKVPAPTVHSKIA